MKQTTQYKNSAIGKIPVDWEVKKVKNVFDIFPTASYSRADLTIDDEILYMHYGDIHTKYHFHIDVQNSILPSISYDKLKKYELVKDGDLIMSDASEDYPGVGKAVEVINLGERKMIAGLHTFLLREKEELFSPLFKGYLTLNENVVKQFRRLATGTKVYSISKESLLNLQIPLPPLPEQQAIAEVLSTWDIAIQQTEVLLSQKELRKKWLMQQLLIGKKRLKGFEKSVWEIQPLSNFIKLIVREVSKPNEPYLGIGLRSHGKGTFLKHNEQPEGNSMDKFYLVRPNDLIVNITFAWEQAIAIVKPEDDGAHASHRFPTYTFIDGKSNPEFFKFFILQPRMKYMLELISPGGAGRNRVMNKSDFIKLEFLLPSFEEQTAIAQVLQTADKEIQLLKTKVEQLRIQKKGLMQQLLTGKTRII